MNHAPMESWESVCVRLERTAGELQELIWELGGLKVPAPDRPIVRALREWCARAVEWIDAELTAGKPKTAEEGCQVVMALYQFDLERAMAIDRRDWLVERAERADAGH
ncbi:MAG: hypothetical protein ACYCWW_14300 [Deltaproteobacteria bacterium]